MWASIRGRTATIALRSLFLSATTMDTTWCLRATRELRTWVSASLRGRTATQVFDNVEPVDYESEHEFQRLAFCRRVLGFIRCARRTLDWRNNRLDRTVMTLMVHHLHAKLGEGLSNQLRHSRAMSPCYSINWWRKNGYDTPPDINPQDFLIRRARWRYGKGVAGPHPGLGRPLIRLGSGSDSLPNNLPAADLVLTSPPYSGVTNYRSDNWLRLWAMGEGPSLPDWDPEQKIP